MTIVLVHGGWHGGWCWRRVAPLLRAAGQDVRTPTLTGTGDRAHLARPDTGLATHVADVVAVLELDDLRDVLLVGHSSSGAVITGVAQQVPERLAGLCYLDAFVPEPGQSVLDLLPPARREHFLSLVRDGRIVRDPVDRAWVASRLRPHPLGGLADALPSDHSGPGLPRTYVPRTYVHCTDKPGGDAFAGYAALARSDPGWRLHELATGHDAMVTAPAALAELIAR